MKIERRELIRKVSLRQDGDEGPGVLEGYAAVFHREGDEGTEYRLWGNNLERIASGAFDADLKNGEDIRALWNHDAGSILGRTEAGTLKLSTDKVGLRYEIELGNTTIARDVHEHVSRGDVSGASFGFEIRSEMWEHDEENDNWIRTINDVRLYEISLVAFPAYENSTAEARSRWEAHVGQGDARRDLLARRARAAGAAVKYGLRIGAG